MAQALCRGCKFCIVRMSLCSIAENASTTLPVRIEYLGLSEYMQLRSLSRTMRYALEEMVSPYERMTLQQCQNACLARSLFAVDWTMNNNHCALFECRKACMLWLPLPERDVNGTMAALYPAPTSEPQCTVMTWMQGHPGRWAVTLQYICSYFVSRCVVVGIMH